MPGFSLPALLRALAVWVLIILAESVQGGLRRALTGPEAEFAVRQGSVIVGALVIFTITWFSLGWMRIRTARGGPSLRGRGPAVERGTADPGDERIVMFAVYERGPSSGCSAHLYPSLR